MLCDSLYYTLFRWKEVLKISYMCFFICCSKLWVYSNLFAQKYSKSSNILPKKSCTITTGNGNTFRPKNLYCNKKRDNDNNKNNNSKVPKTVIAGSVEEDEYPKRTKSSISHVEYTVSDSQSQLLAFSWQSCLELTGEGVKDEFLAPSVNQCSG